MEEKNEKKAFITNFIWAEVYLRKSNEIYLDMYLDVIKWSKKLLQVLTLAIAFAGILGVVFYKEISFIAVFAIAVIQCCAFLSERVFMSDNDIAKVMDLRIKNILCLNKFEKLFLEINCLDIPKETAINKIYSIRDEFIDIHKDYNSLFLPDCQIMKRKAEKEAKKYLSNAFNLPWGQVEEVASLKQVRYSLFSCLVRCLRVLLVLLFLFAFVWAFLYFFKNFLQS